mgnify:CR=1 FL=1
MATAVSSRRENGSCIVALSAPKDGVGRTMLAAHLAVAALRNGTPTGLVDLDTRDRGLTRWLRRRQQIVGTPVDSAGDEIGRGRCHQQDIGPARQLDMSHRRLGAGVQQFSMHRVAGQRLQGQGGNETGSGRSHDYAHLGCLPAQQPDQLGTLSPALSDPPMAPGTYTLELRHGAQRKTVSATVAEIRRQVARARPGAGGMVPGSME